MPRACFESFWREGDGVHASFAGPIRMISIHSQFWREIAAWPVGG